MKEVYIQFMAGVNPQTSSVLVQNINDFVRQGFEKIHLLISTPGGSVFHGLSIYNMLKGLPVEVITYNFGSVDSIGVILFCAGRERYSVPNARFLIHEVSFTIQGQAGLSFDEYMLHEHLKNLKIDKSNIAKVIASTIGKTEKDILKMINERTTLSPEQAKEIALVTDIKTELIPKGATVITIT